MVVRQGKNRSEPRVGTGTLVSDVVSEVISKPIFSTKMDGDLASHLNSKTNTNTNTNPSSKKKELPHNFHPDPSNEQFAKSNGLDLNDELDAFYDLHGF